MRRSRLALFALSASSDDGPDIVNRNSGKCLDITDVSTANGGRLQPWSCAGSDNQAFAVETGGVTRLRAKHSGRRLDTHRLEPG